PLCAVRAPTATTEARPTMTLSSSLGLSTTQGPAASTTVAAVPSTTPAAAKPSVLQGKMAITVPSCAAFVATVNAASSIKAGLAATANAPVAYIDVKLACNARLLSQTRRLADDETVNADYTITIPVTDQTVAALSVIALLGGSVSAGIAQTISQQTGITVTVSVTKPVVVEDNQTPTTVSQTPGTSSDVNARSTSSARTVTATSTSTLTRTVTATNGRMWISGYGSVAMVTISFFLLLIGSVLVVKRSVADRSSDHSELTQQSLLEESPEVIE
ncbi:unnamed protein product, partial [Polarella glacialis]